MADSQENAESHENTATLLIAAQNGIPGAANELYRRHVNRVRAIVRAQMGPALRVKEQSDDLVQEALVKSLAGLDQFEYRSDGAFLAFLAKKVREVIADRADHWNAKRRKADCEIPLGSRTFDAAIPLSMLEVRADAPPDRIAALREDFDRLAAALDALREKWPEYWRLVVAVKLEGRTYAELAEELDGLSTAATVEGDPHSRIEALKQKTRRAMVKLVQIFENVGSVPLDGRT